MSLGAHISAASFAVVVFVVVFELVRRHRLQERYALLWLTLAFVLLLLAAWPELLGTVARSTGIRTPSNALFAVAFAFALFLLLALSVAFSRLSAESRTLAQRLAILEQRLAAVRDDQKLSSEVSVDDGWSREDDDSLSVDQAFR